MLEDRGLQGLRGVASLQVLLYHITLALPFLIPIPILYTGYTGVDLFFVISAYILTKKMMSNDYHIKDKFQPVVYYLRRIFRIWPLYIIFVFVFAVTMGAPLIWQDFIFAQNFLSSTYDQNPLWTLTVEEIFYLILPIWFYLFRKNLKYAFLGFAALSFAFASIVMINFNYSACTYAGTIGSVNLNTFATSWTCPTYLFVQFPMWTFAYSLGTIAAFGKQIKMKPMVAFFAWLLALVVLADVNFVTTSLVISFICYIVLCNLKESLVFTNKVMHFLGSLTYPIYLLGLPMLWLGYTYFHFDYVWILVDTAGVIGTAYLVHRFIEKPMIGLGRRLERTIFK